MGNTFSMTHPRLTSFKHKSAPLKSKNLFAISILIRWVVGGACDKPISINTYLVCVMEEKKLRVLLAENDRLLMQKANELEITKEEIVSILSPTYKGDMYRIIYFR